VEGGLVWLRVPPHGELGSDLAHAGDEPTRPTLERLDLTSGKLDVLVEAADSVRATGNGKHLLVRDQATLRLLPSAQKVEDDAPENVTVDLSRVRIEVD